MNIDFQKARQIMVDSQLRTNKIVDPNILNIFKSTKKENFLFDDIKGIAYSDSDIELDINRGYLKNLHIAQLISHAEIKISDKILHIGAMTGYVSIMLSKLCMQLIAIENNEDLRNLLQINLQKNNITNVKQIKSEYADGFIEDSPYDIIFIDNPIDEISIPIKNQIKPESGKIIMIKNINNFLCKAYKIINHNNEFTYKYLFDVFSKYRLYKNNKSEFVF